MNKINDNKKKSEIRLGCPFAATCPYHRSPYEGHLPLTPLEKHPVIEK